MKDAPFMSGSGTWETPDDLYNNLNGFFRFNIDAAANKTNTKCGTYYRKRPEPKQGHRYVNQKEVDGIVDEWPVHQGDVVWCNPPYGRDIGKWLDRGYEASENGATVVFLLPARTDTHWFHSYSKIGEVWLFKGRIKFMGAQASAPFPSMLLIFDGDQVNSGTIRLIDPNAPLIENKKTG